MQLNYLEVNGNLEEVTCHGTPVFPMEVYLDDLDLYPNRSIPWHWHKELELVYVLRGAIRPGSVPMCFPADRAGFCLLICCIWSLPITISAAAPTAPCWRTLICFTAFQADW